MYERPAAGDDTDELLEDALADTGGKHGRAGGRFGARLGAMLLPVRRHREETDLPSLLPDDALRLAVDVVGHHGQVLNVGRTAVRGVIGSGAMNMNPAVVVVHVHPGGRVVVQAAAKEGLIPQRTARKAVRQVIESMRLAYRATPPS
jgi:hypothetical protein